MDESSIPEYEPMPEDLSERIKPELSPGERLLWAAWERPAGAGEAPPFLYGSIWALGFLVLSALGFAGLFGYLGRRFAPIEVLCGTVGVLAGIIGFFIPVGMLGSWVTERGARSALKRKYYALTDRRAILWTPRAGSSAVEVRSFPRGTIAAVHRAEYPDGSGDVLFERTPTDRYQPAVGFEGIADVRRVEDLARRVLLAPDPQSSI